MSVTAAQNSAPTCWTLNFWQLVLRVIDLDNDRVRKDSEMVELTGIEPVTPWLQTRCSPS
jgi:hypothetical protein